MRLFMCQCSGFNIIKHPGNWISRNRKPRRRKPAGRGPFALLLKKHRQIRSANSDIIFFSLRSYQYSTPKFPVLSALPDIRETIYFGFAENPAWTAQQFGSSQVKISPRFQRKKKRESNPDQRFSNMPGLVS